MAVYAQAQGCDTLTWIGQTNTSNAVDHFNWNKYRSPRSTDLLVVESGTAVVEEDVSANTLTIESTGRVEVEDNWLIIESNDSEAACDDVPNPPLNVSVKAIISSTQSASVVVNFADYDTTTGPHPNITSCTFIVVAAADFDRVIAGDTTLTILAQETVAASSCDSTNGFTYTNFGSLSLGTDYVFSVYYTNANGDSPLSYPVIAQVPATSSSSTGSTTGSTNTPEASTNTPEASTRTSRVSSANAGGSSAAPNGLNLKHPATLASVSGGSTVFIIIIGVLLHYIMKQRNKIKNNQQVQPIIIVAGSNDQEISVSSTSPSGSTSAWEAHDSVDVETIALKG